MPTQVNGTTGVDKHQDGSVKQEDLGANVAGNGPAFRAYLSSNQTVSNNVFTKIAYDVEVFDLGGGFASSKFQPSVAGYYSISAVSRQYGSTSITSSSIAIYKNDELYSLMSSSESVVTQFPNISDLVYLNGTTDYVEIFGRLIGTGTLQFVGGVGQQVVSGFLARAAQ